MTAPSDGPFVDQNVATRDVPGASPDAYGQSQYQVRFEWGEHGARFSTQGAHVVVLVDAFDATTRVVPESEDATAALVTELPSEAGGIAAELSRGGAVVLTASLRNRAAVAQRILDLQNARGTRTLIAVIAFGRRWPDGQVRFAIEDQLTAGAVIDGLIALGIDYTSPEAATASSAFAGLSQAIKHVFSASVSGKSLTASGHRNDVLRAAQLDVSDVVPEYRDGAFRAS